jgi:hypothetical protein
VKRLIIVAMDANSDTYVLAENAALTSERYALSGTEVQRIKRAIQSVMLRALETTKI